MTYYTRHAKDKSLKGVRSHVPQGSPSAMKRAKSKVRAKAPTKGK